jgi:tRNA (cmo5U34)-methyltransferase
MAESNTWLTDKGASRAETYLAESDAYIVERVRVVGLMRDILGWNFETVEGLSLLDLGCGDGRVSRLLAERYPKNTFTLLDGSSQMLGKAKKTMEGVNAVFSVKSFERLMEEEPEDQKYDFVFSSLAIHHLDFRGKQRLYCRIYRELKFGGLFLNYDVVLPSSERAEKWHFSMWRDWIREQGNETGRFDLLPESYKAKAENKPSRLADHLRALEESGFCDVECHYKYGIFCLYGGTKR